MRTITITLLLFVVFHFSGISQVADGINYQAVALDSDGNEIVGTDADWNIIGDKQFDVRFSIMESTPEGELLYQETHLAHTDPFGMFSLVIGHGDDTGEGLHENLTGISWGVEKLFLKVEIDIERDGSYITMDIQQMMAVPFAFRAHSAGTAATIQAEEGQEADKAIFSVLNSQGDTVFAVYESGVVINIDEEESKGSRGGFAVGGFSAQKQGERVEYLRVDPGSVRITIDDTDDPDGSKGSRGGFAVGGFTAQKQEEVPDYFHLTPGSALFQFNEDELSAVKGSRGGFAVGGFSAAKSDLVTDYLTVNRDSVRIFIDDTPDLKGSRGGFAVGGFSSQKQGEGFEFIRIEPGYVRVNINQDDSKGSRGGFAVGGFSSQKQSDTIDYMFITPTGTQFLLNEDSAKGSRGGFAVGGFSSQKSTGIADYFNLSADSARVYIEDNEGRGGFAVVERDDSKGKDQDVFYVAPEGTSVYLKENSKNLPDGFSVFNREDDIIDRLFTVSEEGTFVSTLFESVPVLVTSDITGLTSEAASSGGIVLRAGGAEITEFGVVYGEAGAPTLTSGTKAEAVTMVDGVYTVNLTGLDAGTTYYIRAYAVNRTGTGYGQQIEFTTPL